MNSLWDLINIPFGYVIRFCNTLVQNNYVLALFLFAVIIEVILLPFGIKQQKNSIRQAKLKPKEMAIRKKYAGRDDRQTQQMLSQEIQEMYQRENYSPLAGCLPLLLQFPIIIALYNIVMNPLKYICTLTDDAVDQVLTILRTFPEYASMLEKATTKHTISALSALRDAMETYGTEIFAGVEGFSDKIPTVDALPNLMLFNVNLGDVPAFVPFNLLTLVPFLTFVVYFLSMKLSRKFMYQASMGANEQAAGCSNKMMDVTMPLFSVYIAFVVPAAIGVYWIFKSILTTLKQFILHKSMPLPVFTEEDYKAAEREVGTNTKSKKPRVVEQTQGPQKSSRAGSVRSLHHIDDEDFEDTRERAERAKAAMAAVEAEKEAQRNNKNAKRSANPDAPILKEDDRNAAKKEQSVKETSDNTEDTKQS